MHRILIIDDEPSICKALTMGLSSSQAGVKVYLEKPVDMNRVKKAVMNILPKA